MLLLLLPLGLLVFYDAMLLLLLLLNKQKACVDANCDVNCDADCNSAAPRL